MYIPCCLEHTYLPPAYLFFLNAVPCNLRSWAHATTDAIVWQKALFRDCAGAEWWEEARTTPLPSTANKRHYFRDCADAEGWSAARTTPLPSSANKNIILEIVRVQKDGRPLEQHHCHLALIKHYFRDCAGAEGWSAARTTPLPSSANKKYYFRDCAGAEWWAAAGARNSPTGCLQRAAGQSERQGPRTGQGAS